MSLSLTLSCPGVQEDGMAEVVDDDVLDDAALEERLEARLAALRARRHAEQPAAAASKL